MTRLVTCLTNLYLRLFPRWKTYFKLSSVAQNLDEAANHLLLAYTSTASYKSRGFLLPHQKNEIAMLRMEACMLDHIARHQMYRLEYFQ